MNLQREEWMTDASCAQVGGDLWFPKAGAASPEAKQICAVCPSRKPCLEFGLKFDQPGIFGGTSQHERRQMRSVA